MMKSASTAARATLLAALLSPAASAQSGGTTDLARRTFMNAEQLMREGKADQALRDYQQVIQAFADTPFADDALMRIGSFHYPPAAIRDLGSVSVEEQEAARPFFEQVRERYAQSDSAPQAFYKLGLLRLEPSSPKRNLDEAYASFYGVVNIYPDSDWVAPALLGAAVAEIAKRNYDRAILSLDRSLEESPHGPAAAESHYFMGIANARLGDFVRAAESLQSCRLEDETTPAAARALDWLTLIYNLRLRPAAGAAPEHAHDAEFIPRLPAGEDLRGDIDLAVSPTGELVVADPRRGAVLRFAKNGAAGPGDAMEGVLCAAFDPGGAEILAGAGRVRVAGVSFPASRKVGSAARPIEEPGGVWRSGTRELYLLDLHEGEVLRFGDDPSDPRVVHRDKDAGTRVTAIAGGPEDVLFLLDRKGKAVLRLGEGGARPLYQPGAGPALEEPVDIAVDALGDVYVLDARLKTVFILDSEGKRLSSIAPAEGASGEFPQPAALAVAPRGDVYIYDERKRTVLRFR